MRVLVTDMTTQLLGLDLIIRTLAERWERSVARVSPQQLTRTFSRDPALSWREIVEQELARRIEKHHDPIEKELQKALLERIQDSLK
jgi:hypothetical protein